MLAAVIDIRGLYRTCSETEKEDPQGGPNLNFPRPFKWSINFSSLDKRYGKVMGNIYFCMGNMVLWGGKYGFALISHWICCHLRPICCFRGSGSGRPGPDRWEISICKVTGVETPGEKAVRELNCRSKRCAEDRVPSRTDPRTHFSVLVPSIRMQGIIHPGASGSGSFITWIRASMVGSAYFWYGWVYQN